MNSRCPPWPAQSAATGPVGLAQTMSTHGGTCSSHSIGRCSVRLVKRLNCDSPVHRNSDPLCPQPLCKDSAERLIPGAGAKAIYPKAWYEDLRCGVYSHGEIPPASNHERSGSTRSFGPDRILESTVSELRLQWKPDQVLARNLCEKACKYLVD